MTACGHHPCFSQASIVGVVETGRSPGFRGISRRLPKGVPNPQWHLPGDVDSQASQKLKKAIRLQWRDRSGFSPRFPIKL